MDYVYAKKTVQTIEKEEKIFRKMICSEWWRKKKNLNWIIVFLILKYTRNIGNTDSAMRKKVQKAKSNYSWTPLNRKAKKQRQQNWEWNNCTICDIFIEKITENLLWKFTFVRIIERKAMLLEFHISI